MLYRISVYTKYNTIDTETYLHLPYDSAVEVAKEELQNWDVVAVVFTPIDEEI